MISKIEIDEEREEKLQQNSSNVLSWILKEIQENQEDNVTIVCKVKFLYFYITYMYIIFPMIF